MDFTVTGDIVDEFSELRGWCRLAMDYDTADFFKGYLTDLGVTIKDISPMRSEYKWLGREWVVKFNVR